MFTITITPNDKGNPPGKLADVELHFTGDPVCCAPCGGRGAMPTSQGASLVDVPCLECNGMGKVASSLAGLRLIGFAVWERRSGGGRLVTFPARQYSVNGERRSFALLRPTTDANAQDRLRDQILAAYAEHERQMSEAL